MPHKVTLEDGSEIETFTQEELEEQKQAALDEFKQENQTAVEEKTQELEAAQTELKEAKELLDKAAEKDLNFAKLREQTKKAQEKVDELKSEKTALQQEMETKLGEFKQEVLEGVRKDFYNDTLKTLAGDDEELRKRIEFEYNRLKDPASTNEEISKKLQDAWRLAAPTSAAAPVAAFSSAGASPIRPKPKGDLPKEAVDLGVKLGQMGGLDVKPEDFN